jgi:hypothetical protein
MRSSAAFLTSLVLLALTGGRGAAMPGQTKPELSAWARANPALTGFLPTIDDSPLPGGGTDYIARVSVNRLKGTFHAEPQFGIVQQEWFALDNVSNSYDARDHRSAVEAILSAVYGPSVAADFRASALAKRSGSLEIRMGRRYGYALWGNHFWIVLRSIVATFVSNAGRCGALDCTEGDQ